MQIFDSIVGMTLAVILIVGGYQFYFLPQRKKILAPRELGTKFDEMIPFQPRWVWVYSGLYYPIIIFIVLTMNSLKQFAYTAFSYIILLGLQIIIFMLFPVKTPKHWRNYDPLESKSTRFLSFVHHFDDTTNCFPSMHVSVATLTSLHIYTNCGQGLFVAILASLFSILIAISTLFTKQHYIIDIPAGVILGYISFKIFITLANNFI